MRSVFQTIQLAGNHGNTGNYLVFWTNWNFNTSDFSSIFIIWCANDLLGVGLSG